MEWISCLGTRWSRCSWWAWIFSTRRCSIVPPFTWLPIPTGEQRWILKRICYFNIALVNGSSILSNHSQPKKMTLHITDFWILCKHLLMLAGQFYKANLNASKYLKLYILHEMTANNSRLAHSKCFSL